MRNRTTLTVRSEKGRYFERLAGAPQPLVTQVQQRVSLSEVDVLGIVWHGRYSKYFEKAATELGRQCGLSYEDFRGARLLAPIVKFHVDYHLPLVLDEEFTIEASLIWDEGARLNTEFELRKQDSSIATTGYTVQMFIERESGEVCLVSPELLERCRQRWKAGEFKWLQ
jgi:acyl-CoA thioester hydrolase